jgi:hypothetical protein
MSDGLLLRIKTRPGVVCTVPLSTVVPIAVIHCPDVRTMQGTGAVQVKDVALLVPFVPSEYCSVIILPCAIHL